MVSLSKNISETSSWHVLETLPIRNPRAREAKTKPCTAAPQSKSRSRITTFDYQYDSVGNPISVIEASGARVTWVHDNDNRLTAERRTGANAFANTFTYDSTGNRTIKNADTVRTTSLYDAANQLRYSQAVGGRTTYSYDTTGNQQIEQPPTGSRTTTTWDYENQPIVYRLPDTSRVTMSYNSDSRRVTKQSASETTKFVWDPVADAYLSELDVSNATQAVYTQEPQKFGKLISQRRSSTSSWYHTDSLGSTRALTNSSQAVSDTYLCDAWGNPLSSTGTTVNPFRWVGNVGYYFDTATGLFYIRARTYQPTTARWTSVDPLFSMLALSGMLTRDPIGYVDGPNLFSYVGGNPLFFIDPSGLAELDADPTGPEGTKWCNRPLSPKNILGRTNPNDYRVECNCVCCGDNYCDPKRRIKCRVIVRLDITLSLDNLANAPRSVRQDFPKRKIYGHEQRHVKNLLDNAKEVQRLISGSEKNIGCIPPPDCKVRAKTMQDVANGWMSKYLADEAKHIRPEPVENTPYEPIGRMPNEDCSGSSSVAPFPKQDCKDGY